MGSGTFIKEASSVGNESQIKEKTMKTKLILLCAFAFLFSACATPNNSQPIDTQLPIEEIASTPEPTQPAVQTEPTPISGNLPATLIYTDEFAGFSLDYPANWFLESSALIHAQESIGYNISIASWDILTPPTPTGKDLNTLPRAG
jgi:hypothetical protein